jgi:hypothetical protein
MVFENRVLRPKRDEVRGKWRRIHKEEIYEQYKSPNVIGLKNSRKMKYVGDVTRTGVRRSTYRISVREHERQKSLGKTRRGWEENIKMYHQKVGWSMD